MTSKTELLKFMSVSLGFNLVLVGGALVIANQFFGVSLNF